MLSCIQYLHHMQNRSYTDNQVQYKSTQLNVTITFSVGWLLQSTIQKVVYGQLTGLLWFNLGVGWRSIR